MTLRSAQQIADWYLAWSSDQDAELDNLKLQKLLYYTQGHALGERGSRVFSDEIQAWVHGPVVPAVYRRFKSYGGNPIDAEAELPETFDWDDYRDIEDFLQQVWNTYAKYASWTLRNMTHSEAPWSQHFNADERSATIPVSTLQAHFGK